MEKKHINPPELFVHPSYTRVITVSGPSKLIFIAGQTPSDERYRPVEIGNMRGQYLRVMEALTIQLNAAGATWDDVVYRRIFVLDMDAFINVQTDPAMTYPWHPDRPPPSTLVGVTRLSHPDFLIEIDLMAVTSG
ncbi:MAG: Rid family hydrolase [Aestuariivirga sp.]|jgi:enamine deaminase RidA (YjgF/YER057c/UK114 family)|uniref:RidA family protein n=1 Tax=Aestuariivirga sp. TaxID=2650926 RepID=UPI003019C245